MKRSAQFLGGMYTRLLSLYPHYYRAEYGEELQTIFSLVVNEAAQGGIFSVIRVGWREIRDLPAGVIREHLRERRKMKMETPTSTPAGDERSSWGETLAGMWPFLILGPVSIMLAQLTVPAWLQNPGGHNSLSIVFVLSLAVGFGVGWAKGWPRWSYPYLGVALVILGGLAIKTVFSMVFTVGPEWPVWPQILIAIGIFGLVSGILMLITRAWRSLHPLYQGIRQDWTRLSFGLYTAVSLLSGGVDRYEHPTFALSLFVPSLFVLFGALVYLRSKTKAQRILALVISLTLVATVWAVDGKVDFGAYAAGAVLGVIVFIPALLEILPRSEKSIQVG